MIQFWLQSTYKWVHKDNTVCNPFVKAIEASWMETRQVLTASLKDSWHTQHYRKDWSIHKKKTEEEREGGRKKPKTSPCFSRKSIPLSKTEPRRKKRKEKDGRLQKLSFLACALEGKDQMIPRIFFSLTMRAHSSFETSSLKVSFRMLIDSLEI